MKVFMLVLTIVCYFVLHHLRLALIMAVDIRAAREYAGRQVPRIARMIFALTRLFIDCRVQLDRDRTTRLPPQFLLIANHQSLLDIPVLIYAFSVRSLRFVGKKELFRYILLVSAVFRLQRHAKIDRKRDFANTMKEIERLARMCKYNGYCPVVFPEGTRSRTGELGTFHSGAVRTILRVAAIPVVSVAIEGGYRASRLRQFLENIHHLRYRVKVLTVYPAPKSKSDIDDVLRRSHAEIAEQITRWRSRSGEKVPVLPPDARTTGIVRGI